MTNLDSILKSRDVTLPTKVCIIKALFFPVAMYRCVSWTINKADSWTIDACKLWCWRRLSRVTWTARRSNQSILKGINPEYSLKLLVLKQAPILWPPDAKKWLIGKETDAGKDWGQEKRVTEDEMVGWHHWLSGHEYEQITFESLALSQRDGEGRESLSCCSSWVANSWTRLSNWTTTTVTKRVDAACTW